jgi:hypothetical protein
MTWFGHRRKSRQLPAEIDNYEGALLEPEIPATKYTIAKTAEDPCPRVPPSLYVALAATALVASLGLQIAGNEKWGNFFAQWATTWLLIGVYQKAIEIHQPTSQPRGYTS